MNRFLRLCRNYLWLLGLVIGIAFLVIGGLMGQFSDIFRKAIIICMECIGLG